MSLLLFHFNLCHFPLQEIIESLGSIANISNTNINVLRVSRSKARQIYTFSLWLQINIPHKLFCR